MRWLHQLRTQLTTLRRSQAGTDLDNELRFHLDQQIAENLAAGMNQEEARRAAIAPATVILTAYSTRRAAMD